MPIWAEGEWSREEATLQDFQAGEQPDSLWRLLEDKGEDLPEECWVGLSFQLLDDTFRRDQSCLIERSGDEWDDGAEATADESSDNSTTTS